MILMQIGKNYDVRCDVNLHVFELRMETNFQGMIPTVMSTS